MHLLGMSERFRHLKQLHIPKPCPASWDDMTGDEQTRHCEHCDKNVHNLSAMSAEEAEKVLQGGKACVRFSRDSKGRIITRTRLIAQAAAVTAISMSGCAAPQREVLVGRQMTPGTETFIGELPAEPEAGEAVIMGDMAVVPPDEEITEPAEQAPPEDATR